MSAPRPRYFARIGICLAIFAGFGAFWSLNGGLAFFDPASCIQASSTKKRCLFVGGPLQMDGSPVFMDNFQQAFLPTKLQIEFWDANGVSWTAPAKTLTDGATIPQIFETLIGDRQSREYVMAAALHDAYCGVGNDALPTWRTRPWEDVHRMFYEALLVNGTAPVTAKIMYAAVYLGGPRWDDPSRDLSDVPAETLGQELVWCLDWIEAENPTPKEIMDWMTEREGVLMSGTHGPPGYFSDALDTI